MDYFNIGDLLVVTESTANAEEIRLGAELYIFHIVNHPDINMCYAIVGSGWAATLTKEGKQLRIEGVDKVLAVLEKKVLPDT